MTKRRGPTTNATKVPKIKAAKQSTAETRPPDGKLLLDDRWLNDLESYLDGLVTSCERAHGHRPSLEDFRQLLEVVLGANLLDRWFSNGDEVRLERVTFTTTKRVVRAKILVGDVLAIPLESSTFAFARVIHSEPTIGLLLDFFRETAARPIFRRTIANSGRIIQPAFVNELVLLGDNRWHVVASDPTWRPSADDKKIEVVHRKPGGKQVARRPLHRSHPDRPLTPAEAATLTRAANVGLDRLEEALRVALSPAGS